MDCKKSTLGAEYTGNVAITKSGKVCQQWTSQTPHRHSKTRFPDKTIEEAGNKCRNPDFGPEGPWCYTVDPKVRWEYCDVPLCSGKC